MCQPKRLGGQRCYGHSRTTFDRALAALAVFETNPPPLPHDHHRTHARLIERAHTAGVQLASTGQGKAYLETEAERLLAEGQPEDAGWYGSMIREGQVLRAVNQGVRAAVGNRTDAVAAEQPDASSLGGPTAEDMWERRDPAADYVDEDYAERESTISQRPPGHDPHLPAYEAEARRRNTLAPGGACHACGNHVQVFDTPTGRVSTEHPCTYGDRCSGSWT